MATIDVKDALGATVTVNTPNANGRAAAASSKSIALSTEDKAVLDSIEAKTPALDSSKQPVVPSMSSGGHLSVTTAAVGTTYTAFASQACKQLTISNQSGVTIEVQQGGSGAAFPIPTGFMYTFFGISNASQLAVRRFDTSNTQVTLVARWES